MSKKGAAHATPPKRFVVPPDMTPLQNHAKILINAMRATYSHRMSDDNIKMLHSGKRGASNAAAKAVPK